LRGRRKSVINVGGIKFFPEEVEAVLDAHPDVRESRVSGEPHERWGAVAVGIHRARRRKTTDGGRARPTLSRTTRRLQGARAIPPGRVAAAHGEREAAAMKRAKAWV
jgi:acyl-CoA synthetase (AMP-forming)/AMP-acid ligase II